MLLWLYRRLRRQVEVVSGVSHTILGEDRAGAFHEVICSRCSASLTDLILSENLCKRNKRKTVRFFLPPAFNIFSDVIIVKGIEIGPSVVKYRLRGKQDIDIHAQYLKELVWC